MGQNNIKYSSHLKTASRYRPKKLMRFGGGDAALAESYANSSPPTCFWTRILDFKDFFSNISRLKKSEKFCTGGFRPLVHLKNVGAKKFLISLPLKFFSTVVTETFATSPYSQHFLGLYIVANRRWLLEIVSV